MTETLTHTEQLVVHNCPTCGVAHAFPERLNREALDDRGPNGRTICCPNGHRWHYVGQTDADRERDKREAAERQATRLRAMLDQERTEAEHQRRRASALKGALTRARNRAASGKCPLCTTTFPNVAEHVREAHPEAVA